MSDNEILKQNKEVVRRYWNGKWKGVIEMKHLLAVAIVLLATSACQAAGPPLSDAHQAEIEAAVSEIFQSMVDGMNEDDAE